MSRSFCSFALRAVVGAVGLKTCALEIALIKQQTDVFINSLPPQWKPPWEVRVTLSHDACPWCEEWQRVASQVEDQERWQLLNILIYYRTHCVLCVCGVCACICVCLCVQSRGVEGEEQQQCKVLNTHTYTHTHTMVHEACHRLIIGFTIAPNSKRDRIRTPTPPPAIQSWRSCSLRHHIF